MIATANTIVIKRGVTMNKKQLEEMYKIAKELDNLLSQDTTGSEGMDTEIRTLRHHIEDMLKEILWAEYLKN